MRLRSFALALAPLAFFATSASAAEIATAKELVAVCTTYAAKDENALRDPDPCRRFLVGFFTAYIAAQNAQRDGMVQGLPATHSASCVRLPDSLSYREMAQRLVRYGNAHPNELAGTPNDLAQHTLETDFPCPPQQAPR
jgi:Ssp1 endopeptidase immunity protein Rap1a